MLNVNFNFVHKYIVSKREIENFLILKLLSNYCNLYNTFFEIMSMLVKEF